jgi:transforming growth factor-beta-induced protein
VGVAVGAGLDTLVAAVTAAGLVETLSAEDADLTVFAPTDEAFADLPEVLVATLLQPEWILHLQDVLTYHVVAGVVESSTLTNGQVVTMLNGEPATVTISMGIVSINDASVVAADVAASNGIAHVIDGVLTPSFLSRTVADLGEDYSTLASLLAAADLVSALQGDGPFTVFAPTNAAFAALSAATLAAVGNDVKLLTSILTYHVVPAVLPSTILEDGAMAPTLNGADITVSIMDGTVMVSGAMVVDPNILASNGIVHGIDTVMMPPLADGTMDSPTGVVTEDAVSGPFWLCILKISLP